MSFFGKIKKATKKVGKFAGSVGKTIDPTRSRGWLGSVPIVGKTATKLVRMGAATAATGLTGGLALASKRVRQPAIQGYALGASAGLGIAAGKGLSDVAAGIIKKTSTPSQPPQTSQPSGFAASTSKSQIAPSEGIPPIVLLGAAALVLVLVLR